MLKINDQLDSAYLKVDGMLALITYMQLDFENQTDIDPQKPINEILITGYGHETSIRNANYALSGLSEDLRTLQELLSDASCALMRARKGAVNHE